MQRIWNTKIYVFLLPAVLLIAVGFVYFLRPIDKNESINKTIIQGLTPGSEIKYSISYAPEFLNSTLLRTENEAATITADAFGRVYLPIMQPYFQDYNIALKDGANYIQIDLKNDIHKGILGIEARGLENFASVYLENQNRKKNSRADWSGLFSDKASLRYSKEIVTAPLKFGFQSIGPEAPGNPAIIEVVIAAGGGPTSSAVNVYDPPIHDYNCGAPSSSSDGVSVFRPSTCDTGRMEAHITGTGAGTLAYNVVQPLMLMTEQLSAVMMQQMQIIGSFLDAKTQMETQREFRRLVAQAHKDYHPSEQLCAFGSYVKSVSKSEEWASLNKRAINKTLNEYYRNVENMSSSEGYAMDIKNRIEQFKNTYCNPNDHNGGLWAVCRNRSNIPGSNPPSGGSNKRDRFNKDIDYFRTLDSPLTLKVNFTNEDASNDEEDLIALAKNLYWPRAQNMPGEDVLESKMKDNYPLYLKTRSIQAKYNVAHNSFANLVGMKSRTKNSLGGEDGPAFMKSYMRDFGLSDTDINEMLGNNPSYYAQMEFLTKKIYQNPNFYTSLYDKPANVDRINVSLEAFQLMHGRDRYESMLRQEMLTSLLVEQILAGQSDELNGRLLTLGRN